MAFFFLKRGPLTLARFSYLRLLLEARVKLSPYRGVVWRGVRKDLRHKFRAGDEIFWWAFSSTTKQVA